MIDDKLALEPTVAIELAAAIEPAEPAYILPPHPEAHVVSEAETVTPEEPSVAEETLEDLVQQAVAGIRGELLQEMQISRGGELNVKGQ